MNVKKALDLLMKRLGNRTSPNLRAACLDEMTVAQEQLEQAPELPWFIEGEWAEAFTEPGEDRVPIPTDFLREIEDRNLVIVRDGVITDLRKSDYDAAEVEISRNAEPSVPTHYMYRGNYIILRPVPNDVYTIAFPGYYARQQPPVDVETSENAWFKNVADLLIAMAGVNVAGQHIKDPELVQVFSAQQNSAENRLVRLMTAHEESNRTRRMG